MPKSTSSSIDDCRARCAKEAQACRALALADYNAMRQACQAYGDPTDQATCMTAAANAYTAALAACQANYDLCVRICAGGGYGG